MNERPVLYVDDDKENLSTLRRVLRGKYKVETTADAAEALKLMDRGTYPVLVADQRMPGKTGIELLTEIRDLLKTR